jgi:sulfoxide reductase heme-binding subunit YedZ
MSFLYSRTVVWAVLFIPLAVMCWQYVTGTLFYGEFIHITGEFSARLLILTLAVTPLRRLLPEQRWIAWFVRQRRYLGVATFAYAVPHLVAYVVRLNDDIPRIVAEGLEPGMLTGWVAMAIFLALAATSNDTSVRKLGRRWKALHRFVYAAAVLTFLHWVLVAFDPVPALVHTGVLVAIEMTRLIRRPFKKQQGA